MSLCFATPVPDDQNLVFRVRSARRPGDEASKVRRTLSEGAGNFAAVAAFALWLVGAAIPSAALAQAQTLLCPQVDAA